MNPDILRYITLFFCFVAIIGFPYSSAMRDMCRPRRAWVAIIGCEFFIWSGMLEVLARLGHPLVWYRTPPILAGSLLITGFILAEYKADEDE